MNVLCWCAECTTINLIALKRDRAVREFDATKGDYFAESIGLLYGSAAEKVLRAHMAKTARPRLTKEVTVAHDATYDDYSASMVASAVGAVLGDPPAGVLNKSATGSGAAGDGYAQLLTVRARAQAGDPVAQSSWAAIESHSPPLARLITKMAATPGLARARRPKRARTTREVLGEARQVTKSVGARREARQDQRDYAAWLASLANSPDPRNRSGAHAALARLES